MTYEDTKAILSDNDRSLHEIYFELQTHYEAIYGENTVVLIEVGSFFEVYGVDNDEEKIGKPKEIGDLLNLQLTRKNKNIPENHIKNPLLVGFPTATFDRYIRRMIAEKKYTIIIVRQKGEPPQIERYVDRILSPGIHADYTLDHQANFVSSIILEENEGRYTAGFASLDVSTGTSYIAEMYGTKEDPTFALDELFRHLQSHPTAELVITLDTDTMQLEELKQYLDLDGTHVQQQKKRLNLDYQNALFSTIYSIKSFLSPIEFLDLERKRFASEAMACLIEFVISHDNDVIKKLKKPTVLENETFVYLGNNPLEQLDIISRDPHKETVLAIMDKTVTSIGRRLLFERVMNPIMNKTTLEARYDLSDAVEPVYANIDTHLRSVYDLERIVRRIRTGRLHPLEINFLYDSLVSAREIDDTLAREATHLQDEREPIDALISYIEKTINLDISTTCMQQEIKESFFLPGVDAELDDLLEKINTETTKLDAIRSVICDLMTEKLGNDASDYVDIKKLDKEGHYLHLTKNRYAMIADVLKKQFVSIDGTVHAFTDFSYKVQTTNVKITGPVIDTISEAITVLESRLVARVKEKFVEMITVIDREYADHIENISSTLATIDVALSNVKCARAYKLVRPDIIEQDEPLLEIHTLRHPLIELREQHGIYIPNDIFFGISENESARLSPLPRGRSGGPACNAMRSIAGRGIEAESNESDVNSVWEKETRGVLLYGINSSGKSSLMKSIGIAVVLAQSGCYVPAASMRFTLVKELFTRIVSRDNITQGLSSFAVEMMELKNIFNRATTHSLVLGDEISHGTETLSAIAIIAAALGQLHDIGALFFFTTHLHQLQSLPHVADMDHIQSLHLAVHYDEANDVLIFDRTLKQGSGSSIYGLEFAQSLHMNATFLTNAMNIRRELAGELSNSELILKKQTSKYNDTLYLTRCAVCGENVEDTHHIREQHTADDTDHIDHFHKDHKYNLIPLCKECHIKVHQGKLKIHGFVKTSKGFALDVVEE